VVQNKLKTFLILTLDKAIMLLSKIIKKINKDCIDLNTDSAVNELVKIQSEISIKRAEIIEMQRDLMQMVEPVVLNLKNIPGDSEDKTHIIRTWLRGLSNINILIDCKIT
jgi:thermostable 8-oxoguanine DNA glycosylase